jgi:Tol biopolymer transport system component
MCGDTMMTSSKRLQTTGFTQIAILALILTWMPESLYSQPVKYNHPELEWKSIEMEHVVIHVHQGLDELGLVVADIFEDIWDPITELYDYVPDTKVNLIFYDTDDYSNGGAYYYNNKIIIWASSLDFDLRGQHNWLRNVLTHEFTHIIQLGASRKFPRRFPFLYLQAMAYESEKRNDVLTGFPNTIVSYPIPGTLVPAWFAEGTAQYMTDGHHYDFWDSNRDMLLRDRVLHGSLFDFYEMESFDKPTVGGESVYNQGFSLVRFIVDHWGEDALRRISNELAKPQRISMSRAMEDALGTSGEKVWLQWKDYLQEHYSSRLANVKANESKSRIISKAIDSDSETSSYVDGQHGQPTPSELYPGSPALLAKAMAAEHTCCSAAARLYPEDPGFSGPSNNIYARVSPDKNSVYYLANGAADWLGMTSLWRYDRLTTEVEQVLPAVRGAYCITPDGKAAIFSRKSTADKNGRHLNDLFIHYFEEELTRQLTEHQRLTMPDISPDGKTIVCVRNDGGSSSLVTLQMDQIDGPTFKATKKRARKKLPFLSYAQLSVDSYGSQYYQPRWHPDGESVVVARGEFHGRDLISLNFPSAEQSVLLASEFDERYPFYSDDGKYLYYSQDKTGIFNVYRMQLAGGDVKALTNVIGCAFMPAISGDTLYYSDFEDRGFRLNELANFEELPDKQLVYDPDYNSRIPELTFNDRQPTVREYSSGLNSFEKSFIVPRLMFDEGNIKPGIYLLNSDYMERVQLSASIAAARLTNLDMFGSVLYNTGKSTIFSEVYMMVRDEDKRFEDLQVIIGEKLVDDELEPIYDSYGIRYRFYLGEAGIGLRRRLNDMTTIESGFTLARYSTRYIIPPASTLNYTYLKGKRLHLKMNMNAGKGSRVDNAINPRDKWSAEFVLTQSWNDFITEFEVTPSGLLAEVYEPSNYLQLEAKGSRSWTAPIFDDISLKLDARGSVISKANIDDFFYSYAGGLLGLKGYSYYSLGGVKHAVAHASMGFPLIKRTGVRLGYLYFKRAYAELFYGAGDAWGAASGSFDMKSEIGANLKLSLNSWNIIPTAITFSAAYGLDKFRVDELDEGVYYGQEWRYYMTLLFDFAQL